MHATWCSLARVSLAWVRWLKIARTHVHCLEITPLILPGVFCWCFHTADIVEELDAINDFLKEHAPECTLSTQEHGVISTRGADDADGTAGTSALPDSVNSAVPSELTQPVASELGVEMGESKLFFMWSRSRADSSAGAGVAASVVVAVDSGV